MHGDCFFNVFIILIMVKIIKSERFNKILITIKIKGMMITKKNNNSNSKNIHNTNIKVY